MKLDHLTPHDPEDWDELDQAALFEQFDREARPVEHPEGKPAKMTKYDAAWCFGYYAEGDMFVPYVCYSLGAGDVKTASGQPRKSEQEAVLHAAQMSRDQPEDLAAIGRLG